MVGEWTSCLRPSSSQEMICPPNCAIKRIDFQNLRVLKKCDGFGTSWIIKYFFFTPRILTVHLRLRMRQFGFQIIVIYAVNCAGGIDPASNGSKTFGKYELKTDLSARPTTLGRLTKEEVTKQYFEMLESRFRSPSILKLQKI